MKYRIERDSMGEVNVPEKALWGAQTERSRINFNIGTEMMPLPVIRAFAILKKAAAEINFELGRLSLEKYELIKKACDEIYKGKHDKEFQLKVWQTGSGTQSNMNVNEVISSRGNILAGKKILHPNDDVNMSQSSNDTFPTTMHIAAVAEIKTVLLPAVEKLIDTLKQLEKENDDIVKSGRTHLQDATPIKFSQEISGWRFMLINSLEEIKVSMKGLYKLALGGTAVGTGINAPKDFDKLVAKKIAAFTDEAFITAENKFYALTAKDALVACHGAIKGLAANMMKIANDVRWLASGPRLGLGEIYIPENEPGSSIMPGKVNPTQCEAVTMVAVQVMGNDVAVGMAASQGNFELNVFMPVLIYNFLQSVRLLGDVIRSFNDNCAVGIRPNREKMHDNLHNSLMLVTCISPYIGYDNAAAVAKKAYKEGISLKKACLELGYMDEKSFDEVFKPEELV
nr:class II fumarate hydratase [uncultured Catonella sp.]